MGRCVNTGIIHSIQLCKSHVYVLTSSRGRRTTVGESRFNLCSNDFSSRQVRHRRRMESRRGQNFPSCSSTCCAVDARCRADHKSFVCTRPPVRPIQLTHARPSARPTPPPPSRLPASQGESHGESLCSAIAPAGSTQCCGSRGLGVSHAPPPPSPLPLSPLPLPSRVSTILQAGQGAPGGKVPKGAGGPRGQGGPGGPQGARGDRGQGARGQPSDGSRRHLRALT